MTIPLKRAADSQLIPEQVKIARRDYGRWNREQFESYCDLSYFGQELINNGAALRKRMEQLFTPTGFRAILPRDLNASDLIRFCSTAKRVGLLGMDYLATEEGNSWFFKIENACKAGDSELAIALIRSGMPISERDLHVAMDCGFAAVVSEIIKMKEVLPLHWVEKIFQWVEKNPAHQLSLQGLSTRPDVLRKLQPEFVRQLILASNPPVWMWALVMEELETLKDSEINLPTNFYNMATAEFAARFCTSEVCSWLLKEQSNLMLWIQDVPFYAQWEILIGRSKYFEKMLRGPFKESIENELLIIETEAPLFIQLLTYLHTGTLPINGDNFEVLIYLADKYGIGLKNVFMKWMIQNRLTFNHSASNATIERLRRMDDEPQSPTATPLVGEELRLSQILLGEISVPLQIDPYLQYDMSKKKGIPSNGAELLSQIDLGQEFQHPNDFTGNGLRFYLRHLLDYPKFQQFNPEQWNELVDNFLFFQNSPIEHREEWIGHMLNQNLHPAIRNFLTVQDLTIYGNTPLHRAAEANDLAKCQEILNAEQNKEALVNQKTKSGETPLAKLNEKDEEEMYGLMRSRGFEDEISTLFIKTGAQIEVDPDLEEPPLHLAARCGWVRTVTRILNQATEEQRAMLLNQSYGGTTPLTVVKTNKIAELLIDKGAWIDLEDANQNSPLQHAVRWGLRGALSRILDALPNEQLMVELNRPLWGKVPLTCAQLEPIALQLINRGAQLFCRAPNGDTPLHNAVRNGWTEVCQLILKQLSESQITPREKWLLLHYEYQEKTALELAAEPGNAHKKLEVSKLIQDFIKSIRIPSDPAQVDKILKKMASLNGY